MPNFPYRGPLRRKSIKGFDLLTDYLFSRSNRTISQLSESESESSSPSPIEQDKSEDTPLSSQAEFLLFLGDFIYADAPLYIGDNKEAYRRLYRRNYRTDSFRKLYEKLRKFYLEGWNTC